MKPSEILENRIKFYRESDPASIYSLYAQSSEFRRFFPELKDYVSHFGSMAPGHGPVELEVFRETEKGGEAEVLYLETFDYGGVLKKYYSKTEFVMDEGGWKIKREQREEQKPDGL